MDSSKCEIAKNSYEFYLSFANTICINLGTGSGFLKKFAYFRLFKNFYFDTIRFSVKFH